MCCVKWSLEFFLMWESLLSHFCLKKISNNWCRHICPCLLVYLQIKWTETCTDRTKLLNSSSVYDETSCNNIQSESLGVCHTSWFITSTTLAKISAFKLSLVNSCLIIAVVISCVDQ